MNRSPFYLDRVLLEIFQSYADSFQRWVGWNNFTLAKVLIGNFVLHLPFMYLLGVRMPFSDGLMFGLMWVSVRKGEKSTPINSQDTSVRNPLEVFPQHYWSRFAARVLLMTTILLTVMNSFDGLTTKEAIISGCLAFKECMFLAVIYLSACTPKPPSKSMFRKGIEAIGRGLRSLLPTPADPVPVPA